MSICEQPDASQVGRRNQIDRIPNDNIKGLVDACIKKSPAQGQQCKMELNFGNV
jgi:hypothetical protein